MIIILRSTVDPHAYAQFTWSDDMQDCDMISMGLEDDVIDVILEAKGHEGAPVENFTVEIS